MAWNLQYSWQQKLTNYIIKHTLGEDQIPVLNPPYPDSAPTILSLQDLQQSQLPQTTSADNLVQSNQNSALSTFQNIIETDQQLRTLLGLKDAPGKGSNSWVLSGKLTKTGKPILANDPHLSLSAPSVWYLAELQGPGLHVIGATLPGVPAVVIGHNDHIAWGVTDVNPNAQDLYIEPQNATFNIIHDTIKIKGQKPFPFDIKISPEGPIISNVNDTKKIGPNIALKSTSLMPNDTSAEAFMLIDYAQNWQDFRKALSFFVTPTQNFVYADTEGNIGYQMAGHIPIRSGWTGILPVQADGEHQWDGFIPFDQLPYVYNPQKGFIVTANNKVVPDNYLYPITFQWFKPPYRAERITDLITTLKNNITMQDMQNMQQDVQDYFWRDLKTTLLATKPLNNASKEALQQLQNWNGDMSLNSTAATIFSVWTNELRFLVPEPIRTAKPVFDPLFIVAQLKNNGSYCKTSMHMECPEVLSQTLANAIKKLQKQFGNTMQNWQWQNAHHAVFKNLGIGSSKALGWLVNRTIATPGGLYTVDVASFPSDSFDQTEGASYREIIDLGDLNRSIYIQTLGQSGNPFSRHYNDQMNLWRDGKYLPMRNQTDNILNKKNKENTYASFLSMPKSQKTTST